MVVARASGMDLASILRQNTFLTLGVRPTGGSAPDGGTEKGPGTGGHGRGPATFFEGGTSCRGGHDFLWGGDLPIKD